MNQSKNTNEKENMNTYTINKLDLNDEVESSEFETLEQALQEFDRLVSECSEGESLAIVHEGNLIQTITVAK